MKFFENSIVGGELLNILPDVYWNKSKGTAEDEYSHPYVGKKVRIRNNPKTYIVTRAYDTADGTNIRIDLENGSTITVKPEDYKLLEKLSKKLENDEVTSSVTVDLPVSKEPVAPYIKRISQALRSEQEAIREYQMILDLPNLPQNVRNAVEEIINDEKDHMVILAAIIELEITKAFPNNGDIDPETGLETTDEKDESAVKTESSKLKRKKLRRHKNEMSEEEKSDKISSMKSESIESTQISTDGTNNTTTYKVVADVNYDEDSVLKAGSAINDNIDNWNKNNPEVILTLVSFGAGTLTYKAKVSNDVEFDEEVVTETIVNNTNELVWL